MPTLNLSGKSALVTGGARRIGREIALTLARAGADLTITYLNSQAEARQTVQAIQELGRRALAVQCDVRSEASVRAAIATAAAFHQSLDVVVNNAAVFASAKLDEISLEQWDLVFETNVRGPFLVAREALPHLRKAKGRIGIPCLAGSCSLLCLQSRFAHAHAGHGQGVCSRGQCQLRGPRLGSAG
jgi:3-oxoacyl-[acyl-carrier protein] reductase/pteridine reductase